MTKRQSWCSPCHWELTQRGKYSLELALWHGFWELARHQRHPSHIVFLCESVTGIPTGQYCMRCVSVRVMCDRADWWLICVWQSAGQTLDELTQRVRVLEWAVDSSGRGQKPQENIVKHRLEQPVNAVPWLWTCEYYSVMLYLTELFCFVMQNCTNH